MIGTGPRNGFRVPGRSVSVIRQSAASVSSFLGVADTVQDLCISDFLEELFKFGITYDVLQIAEMPHAGVEACCLPESLVICIREDVYEKACLDDARARFTIIHEFGHLVLGHSRTLNRAPSAIPTRTFEDSEWQADQFAAEFLMPYHLIQRHKLYTAEEIQRYFRVSLPAAHRRVNQLKSRCEI